MHSKKAIGDKLDVISVETKGCILNICGYKNDFTFLTQKVLLKWCGFGIGISSKLFGLF